MARLTEITAASVLDARPAEVWERVITSDGINDEMRPWMRMTMPRGFASLDAESVPIGERIGRSWILAFGLIPFDYDDLMLTELEPGRGFLEESSMLSQRYWRHERRLAPAGDGHTLVTDRVAWQPRLGLPGGPLRPVIGAFFRHRHSRLRRHFGGVAAE